MARFLRHINASRWYTTGKHLKWLPPGEIQGNALRDIACGDNKISIYRVSGDTELRDTIAALAAGMNPAAFSYTLIDENRLSGFFLLEKTGETIDLRVNARHVDLVHVTASEVLRLAQIIVESERTTTDRDDVISYVAENFIGGKFTKRPENAGWDRHLEALTPPMQSRRDPSRSVPSVTLSRLRSARDKLVEFLMRL